MWIVVLIPILSLQSMLQKKEPLRTSKSGNGSIHTCGIKYYSLYNSSSFFYEQTTISDYLAQFYCRAQNSCPDHGDILIYNNFIHR